MTTQTTRRNFLLAAGAGAASLAFSQHVRAENDVVLAIKATPTQVALLPGQPTQVWQYRGEVLQGDPGSLQSLSSLLRFPLRSTGDFRPQRLAASYLGPIIHLRRGQRVRVHFTNELTEQSIIHWHGLYVPERMDGHPREAIAPGQTYVYEFEVTNRAGTYWFHPHPDTLTGGQVNRGLAGLCIVSDEEEEAAGLPSGAYDLPLVIQDRSFDADNQFVYLSGSMMERLTGFLGNRILVNGRQDFSLWVERRAYRLRLLNGSNSRIYKLAWSNGASLTVIATDGGLLERPVRRDYVMLAPGERVELLADFGQFDAGSNLELNSLSFNGAGGMGGQALPNGAPFTVLRVMTGRGEAEKFSLPAMLSTFPRHRIADAVNANSPRAVNATMAQMRWLLNGRSFEMEAVAPNEIVKANTLELWELNNDTGGMMTMPHPLHIHGPQFQVIERQIAPGSAADWETVRHGYVDEGWKDTLLLMPGERAKVLLKFGEHTGLFVYHCHNLEHEDAGMMRNYLVRA